MKLTIQQNECFDRIRAFINDSSSQIFILKGYAGTGKTTLIDTIATYLTNERCHFQLMAPTGRAAKVLRSKVSSQPAATIHRTIYSFSHLKVNKEEDSVRFIYPLHDNELHALCIVDEASMVSSRKSVGELFQFGTGVLLEDLLTYADLLHGGKIIFVGDPMQLPPVGDNESNALNETYLSELGFRVATYELTEIIRQDKESCILKNSMTLRNLYKQEEHNELVFERSEGEVMDMSVTDVAHSYCETDKDSSAVICYSNHQASAYNKAIRHILYPDAQHVVPGDRLMVVQNCYDDQIELLNGDLLTVVDVDQDTTTQTAPIWKVIAGEKKQVKISLTFRRITCLTADGIYIDRYMVDSLLENKEPNLTVDEVRALFVNTVIRCREQYPQLNPNSDEFFSHLVADKYFNALHVKYGYAFTCHKSQGGEWDTVYVDFLKRTGLDKDSLRWKYTAITRARKQLWCINFNDITPLSSLKINAIQRTSKVAADALSFADSPDTPSHPSNALPGVKAKYWSVTQHLASTVYSVRSVTCRNYRDSYQIATPGGDIRVDCLYNGAGMFTRYESDKADQELLDLFRNDDNLTYRYTYEPSLESLRSLHHRLVSLCDELDILITNVVEGNYKVTYYLRTTGHYASLNFTYNAKGFISYVNPLSELGADDEKLTLLLNQLN